MDACLLCLLSVVR